MPGVAKKKPAKAGVSKSGAKAAKAAPAKAKPILSHVAAGGGGPAVGPAVPADPGDESINTPWSARRVDLVLAHLETRNKKKLNENRNAKTVKLQDLMDEFAKPDGRGKPDRKTDLKGILNYLRDSCRRFFSTAVVFA